METTTFEYVIVGAGAAGCVLANRLSEDPGTTVLLLEAGGRDRSPLLRIPAGFSKLMGTKYNWNFYTEPQRHLNNRRIFLPQGKALGGSTSINAMLYVRGNKLDYDEWRDLGKEGWGYDDVLAYFKKSEHNERLSDEYHGTGGPLNVADQITINPLSRAFVRASQQAGIPFTHDPNGKEQEGVFYHQVTQRDGRRESASTAFLHPVMDRPNLTVLTGANVTKVAVTKDKATAVEYRRGRKSHSARASSEVILSAGAINSPRLLMLSGIGAASHLESVGVEPVHDLPGVGDNLHDQLEIYITADCKEPISYNGEDRWHKAIKHVLQYSMYRSGPATATVTEGGAFVYSGPDVRSPDIQLHMLPAYGAWDESARTLSRVPGHGITIIACNIRPISRGSVKLTSADPQAPPAVDPNYVAEPEDWKITVKGFHWIRKVLSQPAFSGYIAREHLPGERVTDDEEIRDYIRRTGKTDYHPVGTCKMGSDDRAVVDARLRVHGIEGLRVIDSSIMPTIISGNTQAPSIMIGEKGADLVKDGA